MNSMSSVYKFSSDSSKGDSVIDLLSSVEKIKVKQADKPLQFLFDQPIQPENLKERFLYTTFEIIADKGTDALSASELIRRTKSSKGALFHHFETIDHLCIESLNFFKKHVAANTINDNCTSLEEYLQYFVVDSVQKQSTRFYIHLVNFFRDRAIRDERYREPLKGLFEVYLEAIALRIMQFLPATVRREEVLDKVIFMSMTIERVGYHRALYTDDKACEKELTDFLNNMINSFRSLK